MGYCIWNWPGVVAEIHPGVTTIKASDTKSKGSFREPRVELSCGLWFIRFHHADAHICHKGLVKAGKHDVGPTRVSFAAVYNPMVTFAGTGRGWEQLN